MKGIAKIVDVPLTFIFLADFTSRLLRSHPKRVYFIDQRGWLDLLGSLPACFRLFRIFRLLRVTRLLGEYGVRNILRSFIKDRADNALLVVLFMVIVVLEFGSIARRSLRAAGPEPTSRPAATRSGGHSSASRPLATATSTRSRRAAGRWPFLVLATGVGLFGVLSGYLANFFLAPAKDEAANRTGGVARCGSARRQEPGERAELLRMVEALEADLNALRTRLASDPTG